MREAPQVSALPELFGLARTAEWGGNPAVPAAWADLGRATHERENGPGFVPGAPIFFLIYQYTKVRLIGDLLNRSA
jgi:hypothetical protein